MHNDCDGVVECTALVLAEGCSELEGRLTLFGVLDEIRPAESGETSFVLAWLSNGEWRALIERAGFQVAGCYGWFDRRPYAGGEDTIWIARRPA